MKRPAVVALLLVVAGAAALDGRSAVQPKVTRARAQQRAAAEADLARHRASPHGVAGRDRARSLHAPRRAQVTNGAAAPYDEG
jgi:hypothetical protein